MDSSQPTGLPKTRPAHAGAHALFTALVLCAVLCAHALAAGTTSTRCRAPACHTAFTVGAEGSRFVSQERFYPSRETLSVQLSSNGQRLALVDATGSGDCMTRYAAPGIRANVKACWEGSPLVITARRSWGGSVVLDVIYESVRKASIPQGVKGIHAGSGTPGGTSGGVGPSSHRR